MKSKNKMSWYKGFNEKEALKVCQWDYWKEEMARMVEMEEFS